MSGEAINPRNLFFDFWQEMFFEPEKAAAIEAFLTGEEPYLPSDPELRRRYTQAANRVLTASGTQREIMERALMKARSASYTDRDYSRANFA